jgi:hypothetical protein
MVETNLTTYPEPVAPAIPGTHAATAVPIKRVDGRVKLNSHYVLAGMVITLGGKPLVVANDLTIDAPPEVSDDDIRKLGAALAQ